MNILALDTSTEVCSVALQVAGKVQALFDDSQRKNTDIILPMIDRLMAEAELKPQQLDCIAFARGPGSFTGVRVATGIAQGIAYAADLPVAPVSTLMMLACGAFQHSACGHIRVINDARMGEVYTAAYRFNAQGEPEQTSAETVCPPAALSRPAQAQGLVVGTGWTAYADTLQSVLADGWTVDTQIKPEARFLLPLAEHMSRRQQLVSAEQALPVYLRDNVAKKKGER